MEDDKKAEILDAVPKTFQGLRDACLDEINLLREGKTTIARAKTIAYLSKQVIQSVAVEFVCQKPNAPKLLKDVVSE